MTDVAIFWFRRDLRLHDNAGLYEALKGDLPVVPIFIFDRNILDDLEDKADARVEFLHDTLSKIQEVLVDQGASLDVRYGFPEEVWKMVLDDYSVKSVYTNRDYEPYAHERDEQIEALLRKQDISFHTFKDHVIFEEPEVQTNAGGTYTVFTPYSKKWREVLDSRMSKADFGNGEEEVSYYLKPYPTEEYHDNFFEQSARELPTLDDMGFEPTDIDIPSQEVKRKTIKEYEDKRNFPAVDGTSRLGIHFRFGTISIREKAYRARQLSRVFTNELIWRDFYSQILQAFPKVVDTAFREKYDAIEWRNNEVEFDAWCAGKTGYPIVDAGMRELNTTGYMHNRVRMVVASFLTKHLLIDWRWGEAYFAKKLLDFDLASNNGGWQWAAGSGTDAAPYFRIFNPESQQKKFDKDLEYIKEWVPEYGTKDYPEPIVEHKLARERCLATYKAALDRAKG